MLKTTIGQLLLNSALPDDMQDHGRTLDAKGMRALFTELAEKHPDKYRDVAKKLFDVSRDAAWTTGGMSFGLRHMRETPAIAAYKQRIKADVDRILADKSLDDKSRGEKINKALLIDHDKALTDLVMKELGATSNPLVTQVKSGTRGKPINLRSLVGGDLSYVDHHGDAIPIPILNGYGKGLTPAEYFAGTFGARAGLVDVKIGTQNAGALCIAEGTMVRMADGTEQAIEMIVAGDIIQGATFKGRRPSVTVSKRFKNGRKDVWLYCFRQHEENYAYVEATKDHLILVQGHGGNNMLVPLWQVEDARMTLAGGEEFIGSSYSGRLPTYDLEVDHPDHLYVLSNGLVVSNSKDMNSFTHKLMVTHRDRDEDDGVVRGMPVPTDDHDNAGSLLAQDTGPYKRNTHLTPQVLSHLKSIGHDRILIRSPITSAAPDGALYSRDVGVRERGVLAPVGDNVGLAAAQSISEQLSQGALSSKHSGGVASGVAGAVTGFHGIKSLMTIPKKFPGGAIHARVDGRVSAIEQAPTGGHHVIVGGQPHYIPRDLEKPIVKVGDLLEAGDELSHGIPNPAELVKHKGIGEGRRRFMEIYTRALRDSNLTAHRRNVELLARGLINHVELTDEMGEYNPGDVVEYSRLEHSYTPREGHKVVPPRNAVGKYLERPVLHHTIGTMIKPSMLKDFEHFGIKGVAVHDEPPPFFARMVRGTSSFESDPDWLVRMGTGSYLEKNLLKGVAKAQVADEEGVSFVPSLARAVDFGKIGPFKDWQKTIEPTPAPKAPAPSVPAASTFK